VHYLQASSKKHLQLERIAAEICQLKILTFLDILGNMTQIYGQKHKRRCMSVNTQQCIVSKQIMLSATVLNWRRPRGRPRITWLSSIQQDLRCHNLTLSEVMDMAHNWSQWMWSTYNLELHARNEDNELHWFFTKITCYAFSHQLHWLGDGHLLYRTPV